MTTGPYRLSRNPMYVSVLALLAGWAVLFRSPLHAGYAALVVAAFQARVVLAEEPYLAKTHGDRWQDYRAQVPRWLGWRIPRRHQPRRPPS